MNSYYSPIMSPMGREQALKNIIDQATKELNIIQTQQYPPNLTQNFQITPVQSGIPFKIVNSIDDINNEIVITDTYFLLNNYTKLYIKNARGDLRTFNVIEDKPKDEKDLLIEDLKKQIDELKGGILNANTNTTSDAYAETFDTTEAAKSEDVRFSSVGVSKKDRSKRFI